MEKKKENTVVESTVLLWGILVGPVTICWLYHSPKNHTGSFTIVSVLKNLKYAS